jgi:hypothetical protein
VGALLVAALLATPLRLWLYPVDAGTILLAGFWNLYNLVLLFAAVMVALDRPQRRGVYRVRRTNRITVTPVAGGPAWIGRLEDLCEGGLRARLLTGDTLPEGDVRVTIASDFGPPCSIVARILGAIARDGETTIRASFPSLTPVEVRHVIEQMFVPANAWIHHPAAPDQPFRAAFEVLWAPWHALARLRRWNRGDRRGEAA